jgi:hypothetical protein
MRVICTANAGKALRQKQLPKKYFEAFHGQADDVIFHLTIGKEYSVFAMALWNSVLIFLLLDETGKPNWYSIELFSIDDGRLPANWFFSRSIANDHGIEAIWGYQRIAVAPGHYEALIERDENSMKAFFEEARLRQK